LRISAAQAALSQALVGQRHDGGLVDGRVPHQHGLELGRHDGHAAAPDDVLLRPT
jgi:hypothetical protein